MTVNLYCYKNTVCIRREYTRDIYLIILISWAYKMEMSLYKHFEEKANQVSGKILIWV